jgi:putative ABC transport system substrate-binding protein
MRLAAISVLFALSLAVGQFDAEAQQQVRTARIGWLATGSAAGTARNSDAFRQRLRELGHLEGRSFVIEYRYAEGRLDRLPDLAADLVRQKVDVIVTASTPAIQAAQGASRTIPIVMVSSADAVGTGLIGSLARPGGNTTGMTILIPELSAKRLELLKAAVPGMSRVAVLWNAAGPAGALSLRHTQTAATALRLEMHPVEVRVPDDFEGAFLAMRKTRAEALFVVEGPFLSVHRGRVIELALKHRLPTMSPLGDFVEAGGLMAYGPSLSEMAREAAVYVDKILKGAKPADLPVAQPTKLDLAINLRTAKALGLTLPQALLGRADQVIE